jgi:hypothetical protein
MVNAMKPSASVASAFFLGVAISTAVVGAVLLAGFGSITNYILMSGTPTAWLTSECGPAGTAFLLTVSAWLQLTMVLTIVIFFCVRYRSS